MQKAPIALLLLSASLTACVSQPKPLYHWGSYQTQVYERFEQQSDPQAQIAALEESIQEARATGADVPPGFHAHLGLLYAEVGKADQVRQQFETEKTLFPESATYMDFLMRNFAKK